MMPINIREHSRFIRAHSRSKNAFNANIRE